MPDNVNHPEHYTRFKGVEVIDITEQLNFNRGNVVKYVARAGAKAGSDEKEDLRKAEWYLQRELARLGATPGSNHTTEFHHSDDKEVLYGVSKDIEQAIQASDLHNHLKIAMSEVLHALNFYLGYRKGRDFPKQLMLFPTGTDGRYQGVVNLMVEAAAKPADRKEIPLTEAKSVIEEMLHETQGTDSESEMFSELQRYIFKAFMIREDPEKRLGHLLQAEQTLDDLIDQYSKQHNLNPEEHIGE